MDESKGKLIVGVSDSQIPLWEYTHDLVEHINGLQNEIEVTTDQGSRVDLMVHILERGEAQPYTFKDNVASISTAFWNARGITAPTLDYITYFLSIVLLEFLHQREKKTPYVMFPKSAYPNANEHVWLGSLPRTVQSTISDMTGPSDRMRLLMDAINQILSGNRARRQELGTRARQVADRISEIGLPGMSDPYYQLQDVFMYSNQDKLAAVVQGINTDEPDAVYRLIDFVAGCDRRAAHELLETFTNVRDPELAKYTVSAGDVTESQSELDPSQQAPRERVEKVTESAEILSDAKIKEKKTETATTGFFGIDSDAEAPEDALGYRDYAKALAATICDSTTGTPFTLGICAPWGRGKSSLMRFIEEEVGKLSRLKRDTHEPVSEYHKPALSIRFDAWKYSKADHIWAGFMDVVLKEVEKSLNRRQKVKLAYNLNKSRDLPLIRNLKIFVLVFASLAVSAFFSPIFLFGDSQWSGMVHWLWSLPALIILTALSYRKFLASTWKLLNHPLTERIIGLTRMPDYTQRLDPVHRIVSDIRVVLNEFQAWTGIDRFVVFIDDIDRCKPDKIMEVLEAIKHFLDLSGFVFLIAMDTRVVRLAIGEHYRFMGEKLQLRQDMGRFYLEKMIQVPFHLPELSPSQRLSLNEKILARHRKVIVRTPEESSRVGFSTKGPTVTITSEEGEIIVHRPAEEKPAAVSPVRKTENKLDTPARSGITVQEDNIIKELLKNEKFDISPRLLKRFINVYMIARHLLIIERENASIAADQPIPESFIKWLAISVRFPSVAEALVKWLKSNNWGDPFGGSVFGKNGDFRLDKIWAEKKVTGWTDVAFEPFDDLWAPDLHHFGRILLAMDIDFSEVKKTLHITNCFNLVLE